MVLIHQCEELEEDVVSVLPVEMLGRMMAYSRYHFKHAFAVVLLHAGNAFAAASIASLVSAKPISGTVPSSSRVAGSRSSHR